MTLTILTLNGCGDGGGVNITGADTSANSATLLWDPPTTNTDGTELTDLTGYKVYYGTESGNYTASTDVGNVTTYTVSDLPPQTYYLAVTAYDVYGNESDYSNEVSKTISP
ncbi:MAG: fibronectin type III domain-containing protein [Nitrospirae bacterium]|nr:fibronectin type III domain-containing protein [Nitrospirota bacterium]